MVRAPLPVALALALASGSCTQTLNAGGDQPHGLLPVDERNPLILVNDWAYDNWSGEYAVLLANGGGPPLAGIVVDATSVWTDIKKNVDGWSQLVAAARASGLKDIPDPTPSVGSPLVMPPSGVIEDTVPNRSAGGLFIVNESKRRALPYRPVVVATGDGLTDVADAYLIDHTVIDRVVVVASLGLTAGSGASMGKPNGDEDFWADTIVSSRFRYVQVSSFYDQLTDVTSSMVAQLPANPLGAWMAAKQPNLWQWSPASDQVAVLAVGLPRFVASVERVAPAARPDAGAPRADASAPHPDAAATAHADAGSTAGHPDGGAANGPDLQMNANGPAWLVTGCDGKAATARLWQLLRKTAAP